jgi:hypothetical protein
MDCYPGSASSANASRCQSCDAGDVCPAGTSLDSLGQERVQTSGTLRLAGITAENFESAKANIVKAIKTKFHADHGVWLRDEDIQLSGSSSRRSLSTSTGFTLQVGIYRL